MDFHIKLDVTIKGVSADFDRHAMAESIFESAAWQAAKPDTEGGSFGPNGASGGWEIEMTGE